MERKRRRNIPTYREWYEQHREQFERTERLWEQWKARHARRTGESKDVGRGSTT